MRDFSKFEKQIIKFTIIGLGAVLVDLAFYYVFLNTLPEEFLLFKSNEAPSKSLSFVCGLFVSYNFNKFWTWKKSDRNNKRFVKFIVLYGISLVCNVAINSFLLIQLRQFANSPLSEHRYFFAFIGATGISAMINFIGQKFHVFKTT